MMMQVAPYRRGKHLKLVITDLMPGYCREVPLWMFDADYCGGMIQGPPEVSIDGLTELSNLLAVLGKTRKRAARSTSSKPKEKRRASKQTSESITAQAAVRPTGTEAAGGRSTEGCRGNAGRPASGSGRSAEDRGRRG
jgi:hypothetical protein